MKHPGLISLLGLLILFTGCADPVSAPKNTGNQHTAQAGVDPRNHGRLDAALRPPLRRLWMIKGLGSIEAGAAASRDAFFAATMRGELLKLRARDGKVLWRYVNPTRQGFKATPALLEDLVCFGDNEGWVRCLDQAKGNQKFAYQAKEAVQAPLKVDGKELLAVSLDKQAYLMLPKENRIAWSYPTGYWLKSAGAMDNTRVIITGVDGKLRALKRSDGELIWDAALGPPYFSGPLIAEDMVIAASWDNTVRAFHLKNGARLWQKTLPGTPGGAGLPALAGETLILGALSGNLHGLDLYTGKLLWTFPSPGGFSAPPVVLGNTIFIGGYNHFLYAINAQNGKRLWYENLRGDIISPVALAGGVLIAATKKGRIYAFVEDQ